MKNYNLSFREMLPLLIGLLLPFLVMCAGSTVSVETVNAASLIEDIRPVEVTLGSGFSTPLVWETPAAGDVIGVEISFPEGGPYDFSIPDAWAFTAPVYANGVEIPTYIPPGQSAHHFSYSGTFMGNETLVITITPNVPFNSELGFWWELTEAYVPSTDMRPVTATLGTGQNFAESWVTPGISDTIGISITFPVTGVFHLTDGYAFTATVMLNGETLPVYFPDGEIAPHFGPLTTTVSAGQTFSLTITPNTPFDSQLGVWYDYTEILPPVPPITDMVDVTATEWFGQRFLESWVTPGISDTIGLNIHIPQDGMFRITDGHAFTATVWLDGEVLPVHFPEGEIAPHFGPITMTVEAGQVITLKITPNTPYDSEVGVWYDYLPAIEPPPAPITDIRNIEIISGTDQISAETWVGANISDTIGLTLTFDTAGKFVIEAGAVFTAPVTLDGEVVETFFTDQPAPQFGPITKTVSAGDSLLLLITPSGEENSEVIFAYSFYPTEPPVWVTTIFLPIVRRGGEELGTPPVPEPEPEVVTVTVTVSPLVGNFQTISIPWPGITNPACLILVFDEPLGSGARIDSGWAIGNEVWGFWNDTPIAIPTSPPPAGELAMVINEVLLPAQLQQAIICVDGSEPGREIGIRIRYPFP